MNLEQVAHFIAHPQELGPGEAAALKELSEKHRYASVFSLLYLTALANGKSVDLDAALQQHAYRLSDRTKLYHLLNDSAIAATVETTVTTEETETTAILEQNAAVETLRTEEPVATEEQQTTEQASEEASASNSSPSIPLQQDEAESPSGTEEPQIGQTDEEPFTFDRVTEAFTREQHFDIVFDPETTEETQEAQPDEEQELPAATEELPVAAEEAPRENEQPDVTKTAAPGSEEPSADIAAPQPRPFTSWLKSGSSDQPAAKTEEKAAEVRPEEKPLKKVDAIIENFIKEEPSITRNRAEFFSPSKKAKESLDEEAVPVSETLAKIYAAQGNYPKAIHVYHQLMLSFPEKKSLFAVQIETLKKKITS